MKPILLLCVFVCLFSDTALADSCQAGTLQDYLNLGSTGCTVDGELISGFEIAPGQSFATPISPNFVQVTPSGGAGPTLALTLNSSAGAGDLFELFFRFNVAGLLTGASISLAPPDLSGDGAVTGVLDVCANGSFSSLPVGCSGTAAEGVAFAIVGDSQLSDSVALPVSSFFDVFADITIDGGLSGSASLTSAAVSVTTPEPSSLLLMTTALGCLVLVSARRRRRS